MELRSDNIELLVFMGESVIDIEMLIKRGEYKENGRVKNIKQVLCNEELVERFTSPYTYLGVCSLITRKFGDHDYSPHFDAWEETINMIPDFEYLFLCNDKSKAHATEFCTLLEDVFWYPKNPTDIQNKINFLNHLLILDLPEIDLEKVLYKIQMSNVPGYFPEIASDIIDQKIEESEEIENWDEMIDTLIASCGKYSNEDKEEYTDRLKAVVKVKGGSETL